MRYLIFLIILASCIPLKSSKLDVGECVLGEDMVVWKLLKKDKNLYLFVDAPEKEGSLLRTVEDISAFKKVKCPILSSSY